MEGWRSYDGVAETYERIHAPRMAIPARDLVAFAEPTPGSRALDVGTGTGVALVAALDALGDTGLAVGIDRSIGMLRTGVAAHPGLRAAADAVDLPFASGAFDLVTANFVIHHFADLRGALFDMLRVLKPGGRLAVSTWTDGKDDLSDTWRELLLEVVEEEMLDDVLGQAVPGRDRFADREKLEETLLDAGLRHVRTDKREYRFDYALDDFVDGMGTISSGRFVSEMLGPEGWDSFMDRAKRLYRERFADPLHDFSRAWLAMGTKQ